MLACVIFLLTFLDSTSIVSNIHNTVRVPGQAGFYGRIHIWHVAKPKTITEIVVNPYAQSASTDSRFNVVERHTGVFSSIINPEILAENSTNTEESDFSGSGSGWADLSVKDDSKKDRMDTFRELSKPRPAGSKNKLTAKEKTREVVSKIFITTSHLCLTALERILVEMACGESGYLYQERFIREIAFPRPENELSKKLDDQTTLEHLQNHFSAIHRILLSQPNTSVSMAGLSELRCEIQMLKLFIQNSLFKNIAKELIEALESDASDNHNFFFISKRCIEWVSDCRNRLKHKFGDNRYATEYSELENYFNTHQSNYLALVGELVGSEQLTASCLVNLLQLRQRHVKRLSLIWRSIDDLKALCIDCITCRIKHKLIDPAMVRKNSLENTYFKCLCRRGVELCVEGSKRLKVDMSKMSLRFAVAALATSVEKFTLALDMLVLSISKSFYILGSYTDKDIGGARVYALISEVSCMRLVKLKIYSLLELKGQLKEALLLLEIAVSLKLRIKRHKSNNKYKKDLVLIYAYVVKSAQNALYRAIRSKRDLYPSYTGKKQGGFRKFMQGCVLGQTMSVDEPSKSEVINDKYNSYLETYKTLDNLPNIGPRKNEFMFRDAFSQICMVVASHDVHVCLNACKKVLEQGISGDAVNECREMLKSRTPDNTRIVNRIDMKKLSDANVEISSEGMTKRLFFECERIRQLQELCKDFIGKPEDSNLAGRISKTELFILEYLTSRGLKLIIADAVTASALNNEGEEALTIE